MRLIGILITYVVILVIVITVRFYLDLYNSKDTFTKDELTEIKPFFSSIWGITIEKYSIFSFFLILIATFIVGVLLTTAIDHWFFKSVIFFALFYYGLPLGVKFLNSAYDNESEGIKSRIIGFFVKYYKVVIFSFGLSVTTGFTYSRIFYNSINFIFFFVNFIAALILLEYSLKMLNE